MSRLVMAGKCEAPPLIQCGIPIVPIGFELENVAQDQLAKHLNFHTVWLILIFFGRDPKGYQPELQSTRTICVIAIYFHKCDMGW